MRLIVHIGFHKTASTYLQHLLNLNADALAARGVRYEPQPGYPAHHPAAWALLNGDTGHLERMIADARAADCGTVILSSEDLEGVIFNPAIAALIEEAAADAGVATLEWHAAIREPGAYFESMCAQLAYHTYGDSLFMFTEVMKKGMLFVPEPQPGRDAVPYWFYCFDHFAYLAGFAAVPGRALFVHDYADRSPYPGWRMVDRLGVMDALTRVPNEAGHNHRLNADQVAQFYRDRVREAAGDTASWAMVSEATERSIAASQAGAADYARAVGHHYADSYRMAVDRFCRW